MGIDRYYYTCVDDCHYGGNMELATEGGDWVRWEDFKLANQQLMKALSELVDAVGALSDPEDQFSCIPAGPELEELHRAWKAAQVTLSSKP